VHSRPWLFCFSNFFSSHGQPRGFLFLETAVARSHGEKKDDYN